MFSWSKMSPRLILNACMSACPRTLNHKPFLDSCNYTVLHSTATWIMLCVIFAWLIHVVKDDVKMLKSIPVQPSQYLDPSHAYQFLGMIFRNVLGNTYNSAHIHAHIICISLMNTVLIELWNVNKTLIDQQQYQCYSASCSAGAAWEFSSTQT